MADDEGWRIELDDLTDDDGGEESTEPVEIPVEPESWSLEGAAFVVLGVAATLFVFLRFAVG
jgi:hypothetical protein